MFPSRGARDEGSALEFDGAEGPDAEAMVDTEATAVPVEEAARKRVVVETFARHEASLRRTAARYSICDDDADEALQRGLEILLLKAPSDNPRELVRWTQTVVKHEALSVRAERERVLSGPAALPVHPTQEDWIALLPSELDGPPERAERDEAVERSREALTTLKPQELRALSLLAEGYSYREIAEITGYSATKVNRCVSEGRERFRRFLVRRDGGERCGELAPLLSAFADDEAAAADVTTLREHLRTCPHCRSTLRAYRAAPHAAAALLPALPPTRGALLGRLHDAYAAVATRVGGGSGASDSTLGGIASAGGTRGAGMTALAKLLAVCAGTVGGAACVATGVIPAPLIDHPEHHATPAAKVTQHRPRELAREGTETTSSPDYATEPATEIEPEPQPRKAARAEAEAEAEKREREAAAAKARDEERAAEEEASETAAQSAPPPSENGATEFVEPTPAPPPSEPSGSTASSSSASAPSGSDGSKGTAAGEAAREAADRRRAGAPRPPRAPGRCPCLQRLRTHRPAGLGRRRLARRRQVHRRMGPEPGRRRERRPLGDRRRERLRVRVRLRPNRWNATTVSVPPRPGIYLFEASSWRSNVFGPDQFGPPVKVPLHFDDVRPGPVSIVSPAWVAAGTVVPIRLSPRPRRCRSPASSATRSRSTAPPTASPARGRTVARPAKSTSPRASAELDLPTRPAGRDLLRPRGRRVGLGDGLEQGRHGRGRSRRDGAAGAPRRGARRLGRGAGPPERCRHRRALGDGARRRGWSAHRDRRRRRAARPGARADGERDGCRRGLPPGRPLGARRGRQRRRRQPPLRPPGDGDRADRRNRADRALRRHRPRRSGADRSDRRRRAFGAEPGPG